MPSPPSLTAQTWCRLLPADPVLIPSPSFPWGLRPSLLYSIPATRRGCPKPFGEMWALMDESGGGHGAFGSHLKPDAVLWTDTVIGTSRWPAPHQPLGARPSRSPFTLSFHNHATAVTSRGICAFGPCHSHSTFRPRRASAPRSAFFTDRPPRLRGALGSFPPYSGDSRGTDEGQRYSKLRA